MTLTRRTWFASAAVTATAGAAAWTLLGRSTGVPPAVTEQVVGDTRVVTSNGIPGHPTGDYPNRHDPVRLRPQRHRFSMPLRPRAAEAPRPLHLWEFGVAVNGVPFDPSGPFWNGDGTSGWQFEVLCPANAVALGIDINRAHTQGRGTYHYHGLPTGLVWGLRALHPDRPMLLLGYAGDGFPIYAPDAPARPDDLASPARRLRPSYRLRSGRRSGGPKGRYDGTFVEDFEFDPDFGDLDLCNGRTGPTPEFPEGTYYYVLTDEFPYIPRFHHGTPDPSFRHGPPPGVSPPLPAELRRYRPLA